MRPGFCLCIVRDCKVTGRPRFEDREFICTAHAGKADEQVLMAHANAAAALVAADTRAARGGGTATGVYQRTWAREAYSWRRLVDQVVSRCGRRAADEVVQEQGGGA